MHEYNPILNGLLSLKAKVTAFLVVTKLGHVNNTIHGCDPETYSKLHKLMKTPFWDLFWKRGHWQSSSNSCLWCINIIVQIRSLTSRFSVYLDPLTEITSKSKS